MVKLELGYALGDELARMEQRMFHVQEILYEKAREKLEEDDSSEWRLMDLINLIRKDIIRHQKMHDDQLMKILSSA
jgi:hypothetical protein